MISLYLIGFLVSVFGLVGWIAFQNKGTLGNQFRQALFVGLGAYILSLFMLDGTADQKFSAIFTDFLVIGTSGLVFLYLAKMKKAFVFGLIVLIGSIYFYYRTQMSVAFLPTTAIELDASGELLVEIDPQADLDDLSKVFDKYDLKAARAFTMGNKEVTELDDYLVVDIPEAQLGKIDRIKNALKGSGLVDWVEENEMITVAPMKGNVPPALGKKYGINDPGLASLWGFEAMEVDQLYTYLRKENIKPKKKALIAILDTGVDSKHEDIKGRYRSIRKKHDDDPKGHGTHCAGIAAAVSNNGVGVASFTLDNSFVEVTSIKVLSASGMGSQRQIVQGMIDAADNKADVISMSLGGRSSGTKQNAYKRAVDYARKAGAIVVAAAGNSNRNAKDYAPVNAPGVIGVSAIDENINRAVFSNYVTDIEMGVAAPGVNIYSTIPGSKYATYNGTSMATPYVAGLLGLMKSIKPDLSASEAYKILNSTGKNTKNNRETGKLIYPYAAVKALE